MRISDNILESVCFICVKVGEGDAEADFFIGTGFFIGVPAKTIKEHFYYLVTAKHVIEDAEADGYKQFYVRVNTFDGKSLTLPLGGQWFYANNPAADVVVTPILIGGNIFKVRFTSSNYFLTDEVLREHGVGVGDDLFTVGLFSHHWGQQKNIPIVRTGIIASMPDEPFGDEEGNLYEAYLVEIRSIGGLSGSPVFVNIDPFRAHPEQTKLDLGNLKRGVFLLGLVRSHWDLKKQDAASDSITARVENQEIDRLNTGIAQVTPVKDLIEILNGEVLMKVRKEAEEMVLKSQHLMVDSNLEGP